ncbi:IclR family transcriptional regulator [Granulosicoccus antarcticus]|uniref:HTH-type transcriptional regulator TsaQ1/TsaQ2 n=1 Tax=Granulosicoccus antarcticus IMCC3135 TaxID=1192854 RepID=A0A2Z2NQC9_9GAMM|nr:IclR family transcriptional regulator [Granulosicoccus antarcticus]ASJ73439.1 HTH-type transcriptional regulator TsaQ1/TsaQ2 [Granulosicoccus antarcticus IMCC3135]
MARPRKTTSQDNPEFARSSRQFVKSLSRGFEVLQAFIPHGSRLGNQEISSRTGLPKPTVSRITYTLAELGYLVYSSEKENYRLGPGVLGLAQAFSSGTGIAEIANGPLQRLADETRGTTAIGQADLDDIVYIAMRRSVSRIMLRQSTGSRMPMATTAVGHAYLHAQPDEIRAAKVAKLAEMMGDQKARFLELHERTGEELRTNGYCVVAGFWEPDINGAATAFKLDDGQGVLSMNIGGPAFWLSEESLYGEVGEKLMQTREALIKAGIQKLNLL